MPAPRPVIIDTDCGVDDAVALWWALTSGHLDVVAITTVWGNVDVDVATTNVCRILEAVGRTDIPVAVGAADKVGVGPPMRRADFIHGTDGIGDTFRPDPSTGPSDEPAAAMLRRVVDERPGELAVVTLGPLSNLAVVLEADPTWGSRVADLVVMGGVVGTQGNALPYGEANVAHDPVAAAAVVRARWSSPPLLVGLDVTHVATFGPDELALLAASAGSSPAATYLADPVAFYKTYGATFVPDGECPCHDLVATIAAALPELVDAPVLPLAVQETPGPAWGATIADRRAPFFAAAGGDSVQEAHDDFAPWRVALGVDRDTFRREARALFAGEYPTSP